MFQFFFGVSRSKYVLFINFFGSPWQNIKQIPGFGDSHFWKISLNYVPRTPGMDAIVTHLARKTNIYEIL